MKFEGLYSRNGSWHGGHGEYEPGVDPALKPCPFCGNTDLTCNNSHTPYYTVICENATDTEGCGAEGPRTHRGDYQKKRWSKKRVEQLHRDAFQDAIDVWNERSRKVLV